MVGRGTRRKPLLTASPPAAHDSGLNNQDPSRSQISKLIGTFAGCAMLLAEAGVFGVISYSVTRRTSEMAIRQSLGATRPSIIRQVLWEGFLPAASGIGLGAVASLAVGGLLQSLVAGISPRDPITLSVAVLLIAGVAASACMAPALRAATTEPTVALRGG